ncbi:MAG: (d)CMP kinase [Bacteroidota bacterium]|nr:(d)CMP kinase [Bacteroidota bacterium]MDP3145155.1 (d)CMP kinase [Bacteroidota bacterium]MDP3556754.1 (d)CMP kinase [Bacteroidota bacterium]
MQKITIAIDGYSSCGKSTLAKALAHKLNYNYIDTGAMYRAVTVYALRNGIINADKTINIEKLISALNDIEVTFVFNPETHISDTFLNNENVEREIRNMEVSSIVSKISSIKEVREKMVALQRKMGKSKGVILDGRDIGTNVFPKAELKLFMTADNDVRANRRLNEYKSKGQYFTLEEVKQSLYQRDQEDINRKENPLMKAEDAIVLDNSDISREEQLEFVLKLIADLQFISRQEQSQH